MPFDWFTSETIVTIRCYPSAYGDSKEQAERKIRDMDLHRLIADGYDIEYIDIEDIEDIEIKGESYT